LIVTQNAFDGLRVHLLARWLLRGVMDDSVYFTVRFASNNK
jgi:hypothetical protein